MKIDELLGPTIVGAWVKDYRSDIDGLRCVAVLPVVFYHYGLGRFSGGYVGVDIFFVISGYLISGIIHKEISEQGFSLGVFYERRVRRILPALFTMLAITSVTAVLLLFPSDLVSFSKSVVLTVLFVSNIGFWREVGYFEGPAMTKPLLHTWSLAVEEQFYLLFPLLLLALRGRGKSVELAVVGIVALGSLIACLWLEKTHAAAVFYLGPMRAWELGLGALFGIGRFDPLSRLAREFLSLLGMVFIAVAVFDFAPTQPPYMLNLVIPCVGAALLLHCGAHGPTFVGRALGLRPVVFVGLISYSLYLWHWPVFVFASYVKVDTLTPPQKTVLILLSVALAVLSWRYVERPFRGKSGILTRLRLFAAAAAAAACFVLIGAGIFASAGIPQRFSPLVNQMMAAAGEAHNVPQDCLQKPPARVLEGNVCIFGSEAKGAVPFVLWGDSHANALEPGLNDWAKSHNRRGLFLVHLGCVPLPDTINAAQPECTAINDEALKAILASPVRDVVMVGIWGLASEGTFLDGSDAGWHLTRENAGANTNVGSSHVAFASGLSYAIEKLRLAGKRIVLVAAVPEVKWSVPESLAKNGVYGWGTEIRPRIADYNKRQAFVLSQFQALKNNPEVRVVYPTDALCGPIWCAVAMDEHPLYADSHHLTPYGAQYVMRGMERPFTAAMDH